MSTSMLIDLFSFLPFYLFMYGASHPFCFLNESGWEGVLVCVFAYYYSLSVLTPPFNYR